MDKKPLLYMLMEIKARELEGRTLLSLEAASRGFCVVIGNQNNIKRAIKLGKLPPGIYFDKSLTRGKENELRTIANKKFIVASQDEEGGLLDLSYDKFLSFRSTHETVNLATSIFCWGLHDYESWTRNYPEATHKIHCTGSPRVDFWRPDFQAYFQEHIDDIKRRFGRYVLISSNFAQANSFKTIDERIEQGKRNGSICTTEDERYFLDKIEHSNEMFKHFVQLTNFLAEKYPSINFIVRPHPAENSSNWKQQLAKRDNIHVYFEGGVSSWIRGASAILHNGCTTGMEAYATNVPAIAYIPFYSPVNREIPNMLSIRRKTKEEVSSVLYLIISGEDVDEHRTSENDEMVHNRLANVKEDTASKQIVDVFEKIGNPIVSLRKIDLDNSTLDLITPKINSSMQEHLFWLKKSIGFIRNKILGKKATTDYKFHDGLKLQELQEVQKNLSRVNRIYLSCSIQEVSKQVFLINRYQ